MDKDTLVAVIVLAIGSNIHVKAGDVSMTRKSAYINKQIVFEYCYDGYNCTNFIIEDIIYSPVIEELINGNSAHIKS